MMGGSDGVIDILLIFIFWANNCKKQLPGFTRQSFFCPKQNLSHKKRIAATIHFRDISFGDEFKLKNKSHSRLHPAS